MGDNVRVTYNGIELEALLTANAAPTGAGAAQVQGNVASGATDSGNPVTVAGVFTTAAPTFTNGQRGTISISNDGSVRARITAQLSTGSDAVANTSIIYQQAFTGGSGLPVVGGYHCNGTTWDRVMQPNLFARVASSAASGNPAFLKASAGDVMQFWGSCGAVAGFLQLYNKASAPVIGTDTPVLTFPLIASANFSQTIPNGGAYFSTGIAYAFTTDAAGTIGSAAAAVTAFALLGA